MPLDRAKAEKAASFKNQGALRALQNGCAVVYGTAGNASEQTGTSIFDPVLCEIAYRWFCPPGGQILDPFAGGSVRGVVAGMLGRNYTGIELRPEQVEANEKQWSEVTRRVTSRGNVRWIVGDGINVATLNENKPADFIFSCPPYGDLEQYSDDPRDLSNMGFDNFIEAYRGIIAATCSLLNPDRFACFVVGDFRDKKGMYRNFPARTIDAFEKAGLRLYNEAILVTAVGSLPVRATKAFTSSRKLGKTHQNVLVFVKGDPRKAAQDIGEVEAGQMDDELNGGVLDGG